MSSWSCPHELDGICRKVAGAYCRPGMKGCVLAGKVTFTDGVIPSPVWPGDGAAGDEVGGASSGLTTDGSGKARSS